MMFTLDRLLCSQSRNDRRLLWFRCHVNLSDNTCGNSLLTFVSLKFVALSTPFFTETKSSFFSEVWDSRRLNTRPFLYVYKSISLIRQSNLLEHLVSTWNCWERQGGIFKLCSLKKCLQIDDDFFCVFINVFVEVAASITNISCITQVTLKLKKTRHWLTVTGLISRILRSSLSFLLMNTGWVVVLIFEVRSLRCFYKKTYTKRTRFSQRYSLEELVILCYYTNLSETI